MQNRTRLKEEFIKNFKENKLTIESVEEPEGEDYTIIRIPVDMPSAPNSTIVIAIDNVKVQMFNFMVASNMKKELNILKAINDLNRNFMLQKFSINEDDNVECKQVLLSENLSIDTLIDCLKVLIRSCEEAFEEIMKAKYR